MSRADGGEAVLNDRARLDAIDRSLCVVEFSTDRVILDANPNMLAALGYAREDVVGRHHSTLLAEADRGAEYDEFWRSLCAGEFRQGEFRRIGRGGNVVWFQASYNPVLDASGRVQRIVKYATDITRAKTLSADHAAQLDALHRSQAVIEFAIDGTILSANDLFLDTVGYTRDELVGRPHSTLVAPEEAVSAVYASFWDKLRAGRFFSAEFRRVAKGGRTIWIQGSYNPVFDADRRVIKVVKFATEVTDLVAQRARFQQLSLVADNTDNSVIITDAERRIQYVNRGFERLTGYSAEEAIGRVPGSFLQGQLTDQATVARIRQHLAERRSFYDEILNYTKAGEAYWVSLAINPVQDEAGELAGYISIQANITETKRAALAQGVTLGAIGRMNAIVEWDSTGALISANEALDGWGSVLSGTATSLSRLLSRDQVEALRAGHTVQCDVRWPGVQGEDVHLDAQLSPMPSLDGGAGGFVMCAINVSERRRAQARSMEAMQENADQIGDFVALIRAITSKTTILALNASIEAARAGDAGRGFSVLAGEVRSLSTQCGNAAKQIDGLLERNSRRVAELRMAEALVAVG